MKISILLTFLLAFLLMGVSGEVEEFEADDVFESSGNMATTMMPSDDEDMEDFEDSGSGDPDVDDAAVSPKSTTTTTTTTTTTMLISTLDPFDEEEELTTSQKKTKGPRVAPPSLDTKFNLNSNPNDVDVDVEVDEPDLSIKPNGPVPASASFLSSSHFVAALIIGGCVGLLFAICVIMLLVYRMKKKDEGSYALDEQKKPSPSAYQYTQGQECYA